MWKEYFDKNGSFFICPLRKDCSSQRLYPYSHREASQVARHVRHVHSESNEYQNMLAFQRSQEVSNAKRCKRYREKNREEINKIEKESSIKG